MYYDFLTADQNEMLFASRKNLEEAKNLRDNLIEEARYARGRAGYGAAPQLEAEAREAELALLNAETQYEEALLEYSNLCRSIVPA